MEMIRSNVELFKKMFTIMHINIASKAIIKYVPNFVKSSFNVIPTTANIAKTIAVIKNTNINELLKCLNCGSCVKDCPQYKEAHKETKSPRGKIRNIKYAYENKKKIDLSDFDKCKDCDFPCEDVCPAKINFREGFKKENLEEIFNEFSN